LTEQLYDPGYVAQWKGERSRSIAIEGEAAAMQSWKHHARGSEWTSSAAVFALGHPLEPPGSR
jgi:hypothetical protein